MIVTSGIKIQSVFKPGYIFPADNGIMTDTIVRDWDHEVAKTKGGGGVC